MTTEPISSTPVTTEPAPTEPSHPYPEHAKLALFKDQSQTVGEFLEWLNSEGIWLARYHKGGDLLHPINERSQALLAKYFDIDEDKLEQEKCAMIDHCRLQNATRG